MTFLEPLVGRVEVDGKEKEELGMKGSCLQVDEVDEVGEVEMAVAVAVERGKDWTLVMKTELESFLPD